MSLCHGWGWCPPQTTSYIHIWHIWRVWAIVMLSQGHMGAPIPLHQPSWPQIWEVRVTWGVEMIPQHRDEADIPLKLLHASILDIYKVIEPLVCCLKGIWVHPYTITPARLAPDLGSQGHLWSDNDVITSWLRLISTSDPFMHPYYAYTKCLSNWYAVSRACWCTLIPLHRPSWPQIWGFRFTWGLKMMP
jgi:hypothetical protein